MQSLTNRGYGPIVGEVHFGRPVGTSPVILPTAMPPTTSSRGTGPRPGRFWVLPAGTPGNASPPVQSVRVTTDMSSVSAARKDCTTGVGCRVDVPFVPATVARRERASS
ncbi:hypothetical protein EV189_2303 [Motilibacter rhizosphaerae]|uniref:Uncharacterized protein n=1 Tax=Motilibacter rhizosphaerae TaxID=598652 RepID=A0A4V2F4A1_9ACTN|nr:hypothetical protein EV189_2303 [Motilibacter rhizosphaerae]